MMQLRPSIFGKDCTLTTATLLLISASNAEIHPHYLINKNKD